MTDDEDWLRLRGDRICIRLGERLGHQLDEKGGGRGPTRHPDPVQTSAGLPEGVDPRAIAPHGVAQPPQAYQRLLCFRGALGSQALATATRSNHMPMLFRRPGAAAMHVSRHSTRRHRLTTTRGWAPHIWGEQKVMREHLAQELHQVHDMESLQGANAAAAKAMSRDKEVRRCWDGPLQKVMDTHQEAGWTTLTPERGVWESLEPEFIRPVLRRRTCEPPLPRHRHYVEEWP